MAGKIFINYRRGDDPGNTGRLFDRLQEAFQSDQLFMDIDNIAPGLDFLRVIEEQVGHPSISLVEGSSTDQKCRTKWTSPPRRAWARRNFSKFLWVFSRSSAWSRRRKARSTCWILIPSTRPSMSGSSNKEDLSERKKLLPVQFGQVGSDLDRVIVVPRQRDGLKFRLFILASLFQDAGQSIMQCYQSAHAERLSLFLLRNPFFELHRHSLEVVIGRIIGIRRSHRHGGSGECSFVWYPLYAAGAGGLWITKLERHVVKLCYFCRFFCQLTRLHHA
jgi:hypothetical protein